jgi:uncharacterized protein DUF6471
MRVNEELAVRWVRGTIRAAMNRQGLGYADLTQRLKALGIEENERNLRNKVARGAFSAVFFVQCLEALGMTSLTLDMADFAGEPAGTAAGSEGADPAMSTAQLGELERLLAEIRRRLAGSGPAQP